jgi:hypothetical protein
MLTWKADGTVLSTIVINSISRPLPRRRSELPEDGEIYQEHHL